MRARYWLSTGILALWAAACMAAPADDAAARRDIAALYAKGDKAVKAKDVDTYLSILTPDYVAKLRSGKTMARPQMEQTVRQVMQMVRAIQVAHTTVQSIAVKGSQATATVSQTMKATVADQQGKVHRFTQTSSSRDTWVKTGQGWKMKQSQELSSQNTMDGKKMPG